MSTATDVLHFLSRLAPSGGARDASVVWDVRDTGPFVPPTDLVDDPADTAVGGRLVATAPRQVWEVMRRRDGRTRSVAYLTLAGTGEVRGSRRTVVAPLLVPRGSPLGPWEYERTVVAEELGLPLDVLIAAVRTTPASGRASRSMVASMPRMNAVVKALDRAGVRTAGVHVGLTDTLHDDGELWVVWGEVAFTPASDPRSAWDVRHGGAAVAPALPAGTAASQPRRSEPAVEDALARWRKHVELHAEQGLGRASDVSLIGTGVVGGQLRTVAVPLTAAEVSVGRGGRLVRGEQEVTPAARTLGVTEHALEVLLSTRYRPGPIGPELRASMPRLRRVLEQLEAGGTQVDAVVAGTRASTSSSSDLTLCIGTMRYVDELPPPPPAAERLAAWAARDLGGTALDRLYDAGGDDGEGAAGDRPPEERVRSALPLTAGQRHAVVAARTAPLSVVSGAPGTGKSHTAIAIALDEVARGGSVLVATRSRHAADVLGDLLERHPGPPPLRFGGSHSRRELADTLADGLPPAPSRAERTAVEAAEGAAADAERDAREVLSALLDVAGAAGGRANEAVLRTDVPGAFDGTVDRSVAAALLARASTDEGFLGGFRSRRAAAKLRAALRAGPAVSIGRLGEALSRARVRAIAASLEDAGGLDVGAARETLTVAEEELRAAVGARLDVHTTGAPTRRARAAVAGLASALRAGASRRAALLARIEPDDLTAALPLWIGTVAEVERLLPATPGLFDLVVLDEASQLDQLVAAPVLARARRAVVIGDPRQLRHVSFVADLDVDRALEASAVDPALHAQLDVRRVSTFDVAAGAAPVRWLDEHLRSVPHLIAFSAERFYGEQLHVTTSHPSVDAHDAIDTSHVDGTLEDGVVVAEVEAVLGELDRLAAEQDPPTVGVVTPFRKQADALERAIVERYDLDTIRRLGLRVGTVHGFQGGERDHVLVALGLTDDGPPQRRSFVQDPNLFNVMVTRARRRVLVVTALSVGTGGLVGAYLDHAERPPAPPAPAAPVDAWTRGLCDELVRNGLHVEGSRHVGAHRVDLTVLLEDRVVGVLTRPHPGGLDADVERYTALRRAGWSLVEVYATPTDDDVVRRALALRHQLTAGG